MRPFSVGAVNADNNAGYEHEMTNSARNLKPIDRARMLIEGEAKHGVWQYSRLTEDELRLLHVDTKCPFSISVRTCVPVLNEASPAGVYWRLNK